MRKRLADVVSINVCLFYLCFVLLPISCMSLSCRWVHCICCFVHLCLPALFLAENARLVGASVGTVLFASPVSTCISRVNKRAYHPTLPPSSSVPGVVRAFLTTFEAPSAKEGVAFGRVVRTDSDTSRVLNDVL